MSDPDGNGWVLQHITQRLRARVDQGHAMTYMALPYHPRWLANLADERSASAPATSSSAAAVSG